MVAVVAATAAGCAINGAVMEINVDSAASITAGGEECDCQWCKTLTHWYICAHDTSLGSSRSLARITTTRRWERSDVKAVIQQPASVREEQQNRLSHDKRRGVRHNINAII